MAKNQNIRIPTQVLQNDLDSLVGLRSIPDYQPAQEAFSREAVIRAYEAMRAAEEAELHAQNALAAARDAAVAAQWGFHNLMLGVKVQVLAQYGQDSDQVAALGLKKKKERKTPKRSGGGKSA